MKRQTCSQAFWDRLVAHGIKPADVAPLLEGYPEWEIAEEMTRARLRLQEDQDERRLRARLFATDAPVGLRERTVPLVQVR